MLRLWLWFRGKYWGRVSIKGVSFFPFFFLLFMKLGSFNFDGSWDFLSGHIRMIISFQEISEKRMWAPLLPTSFMCIFIWSCSPSVTKPGKTKTFSFLSPIKGAATFSITGWNTSPIPSNHSLTDIHTSQGQTFDLFVCFTFFYFSRNEHNLSLPLLLMKLGCSQFFVVILWQKKKPRLQLRNK